MTPNHDHGTLFVAPPSPPATDAASESGPAGESGPASESGPAVDDGAEAMRRLRHPFAAGSSTVTTRGGTSHRNSFQIFPTALGGALFQGA